MTLDLTIAVRSITVLWVFGAVSCERRDPPQQFHEAMVKTVAERSAIPAWRALPESYHRDLDGILSDVIAKVDPLQKIYDQSFVIAGKVGRILIEKKQLVLGCPLLANVAPTRELRARLERTLEPGGRILEELASSELRSVSTLRQLDMKQFFSGTLSRVIVPAIELLELIPNPSSDAPDSDFLAEVATARFTVVRTEGDEAVVRVEVEGQPLQEDVVVRVDGKWLPRQLASGWSEWATRLRTMLAQLDLGGRKHQIELQLDSLEYVLDALLAAKTQDEFDTKVEGLLTIVALLSAFGNR